MDPAADELDAGAPPETRPSEAAASPPTTPSSTDASEIPAPEAYREGPMGSLADLPPPSGFSVDSGAPLSPGLRSGHPVRDRLLSRAASVEPRSRSPQQPNDDDPFSALQNVSDELNEVAVPRRQRSLSGPAGPGALSPAAVMATGTLVGCALIASLFALLVQFAPRNAPSPVPVAAPEAAEPSVVVPEASANPQPAPPVTPKQPGPWRITRAQNGQQLIRGTVGRAAFLNAIQEAGLSKSHAYQAYNSLKEIANLDHCRPTNEFVALVDRTNNELLAFEYIAGKEEIYQARKDKNGVFAGKQLDLKVERARVEGAFTITGDSFAASVQGSKLDPSIGSVINKALDGHTSVEQFRLGDRLRVIAQQVTVLGEFARYSGIEALEYLPVNGSPLRIYYYSAKRRYYDSKGRAPGEGGWRKPIKGAPITSKFNPNRLHPILKKRMPHNGTDFGAPTGTPIHSASYGTINKLGPLGPNGNFIGIAHAKGYETGYSHLSRFEPGLKVGDKVEALQVIGYVGSTGRSTGPHLHFSAKKNGAFIDPESLNLDALVVLPVADRAAFDELRRGYDKELDAINLTPPVAVTAPAVSVPPAAEEFDQEEGPAPLPPAAQAGAAPANAPAAPPAQPEPRPQTVPAAAPAVVPKPAVGRSIYLSDQELLQTQGSSDDGEVDE